MSSFFLLVLSKCYGALSFARNYLYDKGLIKSYQSSIPVISIGNITAGGNAKTPLAMYLAQALLVKGYKPVVLSRGYKGSTPGPYIVNKEDAPEKVGDEPCQMAQNLDDIPIIIAKKKVAGVRFIEEAKLGNVIILDDGFQHRKLARDIDILSINIGSENAIDSFLAGELLPLGRFREDRDQGLERASMVVLAQRAPIASVKDIDPKLLKIMPPNIQIYRSYLETEELHSLDAAQVLEPCEVLAFCGIANPSAFYSTLESMGYSLRARCSFKDHHFFKPEELNELAKKYPDLPLVCTEKDAVKLKSFGLKNCYALKVKTKLKPADAFIVQISKMLFSKKEAQDG